MQRSRPNALHLQMLQSTFLTTESGHTLVCKLGIALTRRQECEEDFFSFLARNTNNSVQELIERVWSIRAATENENAETISRIEELISTGNQECFAICNGKWLQAACKVLS